jgi:hypothetical protein
MSHPTLKLGRFGEGSSTYDGQRASGKQVRDRDPLYSKDTFYLGSRLKWS